MTHFTHYSHSLSELADELMVWANDWVILGSDPYAGIGEIKLPEVEPGSSIMPGKINPSILEAMKMVCLQVQGNNETIRLASESTQLELNVMTPVMGSNLFESISLLTNALRMFRTKCLTRVKPTSRMETLMSASVSTATSLNPYLGYDVVAHVVKRSMREGISVSELLVKEKILTREEVFHLMNPIHLTQPGKIDAGLKETIRGRPSYSKIKSLVQRLAR
jgi:aspartate ammonia-lyase